MAKNTMRIQIAMQIEAINQSISIDMRAKFLIYLERIRINLSLTSKRNTTI